MKSSVWTAVVVLAALGVAAFSVYRTGDRPGAALPAHRATPEELVGRAKALAENELQRLNAAEMIYRNKVAVHGFVMSESGSLPTRKCLKLYRVFKSFEVSDIEQTPSMLHPIRILVRYNFDLIGTRGEPVGGPDPAIVRRVSQDHAFVVHRSESVALEYLCDESGKVVHGPELPGRPNIFNTPALGRFGEFTLEEAAVPADGS